MGLGGIPSMFRIGRGTLHIDALCLSISVGFRRANSQAMWPMLCTGGLGDDGLLQRFQLLVWPDSPRDWTNIDRWPDTQAKNAAYRIFEALDALTPHDVGAIQATDEDIPALRFARDAQELFDAWREQLELRLRQGNGLPAFESHLGKYRSLMPSLALVFHLVEVVGGHAGDTNVSLDAARLGAA